MPAVRVERLPVQLMGLGLLGFDHLQIVFQADFGAPASAARQDDWFVIEGLREPDVAGTRLGVEGWHGGTTLSEANGGLAGAALSARIGTSESRGGHDIAAGSEAMSLWATLSAYAADIEAQKFPYIAFALPGSPLPMLNSSSLVASLLHHAGVDVDRALPAGVRFSPGIATLLGTSREDELRTSGGFSTLVAGGGNDRLLGGDHPTEKLYGGAGNDTFFWSSGVNIIHGGQPGLDYEDDGTDTLTYTGAGDVTIEAPPERAAHVRPEGGQDLLFSIEEIVWDGAGDRLSIGPGMGLAAKPLRVDLGTGGTLDLSQSDVGFTVTALAASEMRLTGCAKSGPLAATHSVAGAERVAGSPHGDRFVIAEPGAFLIIDNAAPDDRLVVPWPSSRVSLGYDADRPRDLVIRIFSDGAPLGAEVRVSDFESGHLGLDLDQAMDLAGPHSMADVLLPPLVLGDGDPGDCCGCLLLDDDLDQLMSFDLSASVLLPVDPPFPG